jgi:hypothetical protein
MSAANYLEAAIVIDGSRSPIASRGFDDAVAAAGITIEPVTREQAEIARAAYRDFGKGSGHPAGSISAIISLMPSPSRCASRCYSRATIFRTPTSRLREGTRAQFGR